MHVDIHITLFSEKRQGALFRAGLFIRIYMVILFQEKFYIVFGLKKFWIFFTHIWTKQQTKCLCVHRTQGFTENARICCVTVDKQMYKLMDERSEKLVYPLGKQLCHF